MSVTRWPDVVDALLALTRAQTGYRDPATNSDDIPVFDGPQIGRLEQPNVRSYLVIGWPGDPESEQESGDSGQAVATVGNNTRDETGMVICRAASNVGSGGAPLDISGARTAAFRIVGTVENVLRSNPTLGLVTPRFLGLIGDLTSIRQWSRNGANCGITFEVIYKTRI